MVVQQHLSRIDDSLLAFGLKQKTTQTLLHTCNCWSTCDVLNKSYITLNPLMMSCTASSFCSSTQHLKWLKMYELYPDTLYNTFSVPDISASPPFVTLRDVKFTKNKRFISRQIMLGKNWRSNSRETQDTQTHTHIQPSTEASIHRHSKLHLHKQ